MIYDGRLDNIRVIVKRFACRAPEIMHIEKKEEMAVID